MDCDASYIGKTTRQAMIRHIEHGASEPQPNITDEIHHNTPLDTNTDGNCLRRSSRKRFKSKKYNPDEEILDGKFNCTTIPKNSAIFDHQHATNHNIDWNNWKILRKDRHYYRLLIRETLAIQRHQPSLNRTVQSCPLVVFPMGQVSSKVKVKMKEAKPSG